MSLKNIKLIFKDFVNVFKLIFLKGCLGGEVVWETNIKRGKWDLEGMNEKRDGVSRCN